MLSPEEADFVSRDPAIPGLRTVLDPRAFLAALGRVVPERDLRVAQIQYVKYKPGTFYLASEFDLAKAGPGDYMSELVAWDPVKQQKVWGQKEELPFMGGVLSTGGGLVFHGNIQGWFKALDAKTGEELWKFNAGSGISQGAITYELDGKQYVAVVSGRLKTPPSFLGHTGERIFASSPEGGAVFVFELAD